MLQAVADSRCFIIIDVGAFGKQSDEGVFANSALSKLVDDSSKFPPDRCIPGYTVKLPYTFLCDDAYPLKQNMMKPYSGNSLTAEQDIFNGQLSHARRCVECAFRILANKWRLFLKNIEAKPKTDNTIVKCETVLHNIVIDRDGIPQDLLQRVEEKVDSIWAFNASLNSGHRYNCSASSALTVRNCWKEYFNSAAGAVLWQAHYIK